MNTRVVFKFLRYTRSLFLKISILTENQTPVFRNMYAKPIFFGMENPSSISIRSKEVKKIWKLNQNEIS